MKQILVVSPIILTTLFVQSVSLCLNQKEKSRLAGIKNMIYGGLTSQRSQDILNGVANPIEIYDWQAAVFVNWQVMPDKMKELEDYLNLNGTLHLAPIRLLECEEAATYISFTAKRVPAIEEDVQRPATVQCDWLAYVKDDHDSAPSLMIIDSKYDFDFVSPMGSISSSDIDFEFSKTRASVKIQEEKGVNIDVALDLSKTKYKGLNEEFFAAFYKLYWPNGVYSTLASNGSLRTPVKVVDAEIQQGLIVEDDNQWSQFLEPIPRHAFVFDRTIELSAEVWLNAKGSILELHNNVYYQRAVIEAAHVLEGKRDPLIKMTVTQDAPTYFMNFQIKEDKLNALAAAIPLPKGLDLAPIRMHQNGPEEYILTLNVYSITGVVSGLRADWSVFVKENEVDSPLFLVIDASSSGQSLDPVSGFGAGADEFIHEVNNDGLVQTAITDGNMTFSATFPMPFHCNEQFASCDLPDYEFLDANRKIFWGNGVYDRGTWDRNVWFTYTFLIDPTEVDLVDGTMWAEFLEPGVFELIVLFIDQDYYLSPWFNLEEMETCLPW